jgi:hypothetical protein
MQCSIRSREYIGRSNRREFDHRGTETQRLFLEGGYSNGQYTDKAKSLMVFSVPLCLCGEKILCRQQQNY